MIPTGDGSRATCCSTKLSPQQGLGTAGEVAGGAEGQSQPWGTIPGHTGVDPRQDFPLSKNRERKKVSEEMKEGQRLSQLALQEPLSSAPGSSTAFSASWQLPTSPK